MLQTEGVLVAGRPGDAEAQRQRPGGDTGQALQGSGQPQERN